MASSPPAPFPSSLPKKRLSMSSQVSATNKRPKLHPLRQTSFPANHDANMYASAVASARSETGSVANSTFSTMSQNKAQTRGRGRPRKSLQVTDDDARTAREGGSTTGARGAKAKSVISAGPSNVNAEEEPEEEEEDDEALDEIVGGGQLSAETKRAEEEKLNTFLRQLTEGQSDRYAAYRSGKLSKPIVRRIINQTVSQSVNEHCVSAVMFAGKAFAIEIIERARDVQVEYAKALDVSIKLTKQAWEQKLLTQEKELEERERAAKEKDPPSTLPEQERRAILLETRRLKDEISKYRPNKHRGGLLPDHLREAIRRYKADRDGSGFGFDGLSHPLLGVKGSRAWRTGDGSSAQRLFR